MRNKWRRLVPGPKLMMAEGAQKALHKERCAAKINEPAAVAQSTACPITSDGMALSSSTADSWRGGATNRGHVEAKKESILCSGSSSERPLVLSTSEDELPTSRMSCISAQNSFSRRTASHPFSGAFERASKMTIFRSRFASDHVTNGSFSEKFIAWRDSASGAVESLRRRLSAFRRTRSLDAETEERPYVAGRAQERNSTLEKRKIAKQQPVENASCNKSTDQVFLPNSKEAPSAALLEAQVHEQEEKLTSCQNGSETVLEPHCSKNECDLLQEGSYVCVSCVLPGPEDSANSKDVHHSKNAEKLEEIFTCNETEKQAENRVVETQPLAEAQKIVLGKEKPEEQSSISKEESEDLTDIPNTSLTSIEAKAPMAVTISQGEQQEEEQVSMESKGVPRKCLSGVNLWDLRNSLEHTTIELRCINSYTEEDGAEADQGGGSKRDGRDVTEASPRSTPSSEFFVSRDKSVTDLDECGEPCIVSSSIAGNDNAVDAPIDLDSHGSTGVEIKRNRFPADAPSTTGTAGNGAELARPKGNVVITKAIIESPPDGRHAADRSDKLTAAGERRRHFGVRRQSSLFDSNDSDVFAPEGPERARRSSLRVGRQSPSAGLDANRGERDARKLYNIIRFVDDGQSIELQSCGDGASSSHSRASSSRGSPTFTSSSGSSSTHLKGYAEKDTLLPAARRRSSNSSTPKTTSMDSIVSSTSSSLSFTAPHKETTPLPPTSHYRSASRCKFQTKPGSSNSSATTSPSSPTGAWPYSIQLTRTRSGSEMSESDSLDSYSHSSSRSSSSLRGLSRLFRRSSTQKQQRDLAPTFCGYTMGRDYCVDVETDRIFKEFLCQDSASVPTTPTSSEPLPPPSHMLPPRPLNRSTTAQLRRQVMRKQYSDSIAMYYGQRIRRWRFAKQKSDSVNCPVDRAVLRRQAKIEEEFDPEEINERLSSTSTRRENEHPDYVPPTVNELMEWRRSSTDYTSSVSSSSRQSSTHSDSIDEKARTSKREFSGKHVTFRSAKSDC